MKKVAISLILVSLFAMNGCGSNRKLGGKVSFEDGKPLDQGTVCFFQDAFLARGDLKPDGSYVVGSAEAADGIPPGVYKVYIDGAYVEDLKAPTGMRCLINEEMTKPETSGLTCEVPVAGGTFDITVQQPK